MSGLAQIRRATETNNIATMSAETQIAPDVLEAFSLGRRDLPQAAIDKVVAHIFGGLMAYEAEADALVPRGSRDGAVCLCTAYAPTPVAQRSPYSAFGDVPVLGVADDGRKGMAAYLGDAKMGTSAR